MAIELIFAGASAAIGLLLWSSAAATSSTLEQLRRARIISVRDAAAYNHSPPGTLFCITGVATSQQPLLLDGATPVLAHHVRVQQRQVVWREARKEWEPRTQSILNHMNVAEVDLAAADTPAVIRISSVGLRAALSESDLSVRSHSVEPAPMSASYAVADYLQGFRIVSTETIERVLPVGTVLTVVGALVPPAIPGQPPMIHSAPEFALQVSRYGIDKLIASEASSARLLDVSATLCGTLAAGLVIRWLWRRWRLSHPAPAHPWTEFFLWPLEALDTDSAPHENGDVLPRASTPETPSGDIPVEQACCVCMVRPRQVILLDCGHVCVCTHCAPALNTCPYCRAVVLRRVRAFTWCVLGNEASERAWSRCAAATVIVMILDLRSDTSCMSVLPPGSAQCTEPFSDTLFFSALFLFPCYICSSV
jgi:E3 ubiquitin-protein ligase MUL1